MKQKIVIRLLNQVRGEMEKQVQQEYKNIGVANKRLIDMLDDDPEERSEYELQTIKAGEKTEAFSIAMGIVQCLIDDRT